MKKNVLVVGYEKWPVAAGYDLYCVKNPDDVQAFVSSNCFFLFTQDGCVPIYGVIWQPSFVQMTRKLRHLLNMIRISSALCLNPAESYLLYEDRLDSLCRLKAAGLPILEPDVVSGDMGLLNYKVKLPCVMKIGSHHGGFGKALLTKQSQIEDSLDLAAASSDYVAFEPFIKYKSDIRVTVVGKDYFSIERVPSSWKANVNPKDIRAIKAPAIPKRMAAKTAKALNCSLVGCDFLLTESNRWVLLEANMICGLDVFGKDLKSMLIPLMEQSAQKGLR